MTPEQSAAIARIRICIELDMNRDINADDARLLLSALEEAQAVRAPIRDWQIQRIDEDDGSITYEIWDRDPKNYRRVTKINDGETGSSFAKRDAEAIVAAIRTRTPGDKP